MSPNAGEGGSTMSTAVHRSPNKLWRSTSTFNLRCSEGFGLTASLTSFVRVRVKALLNYAFSYLFIQKFGSELLIVFLSRSTGQKPEERKKSMRCLPSRIGPRPTPCQRYDCAGQLQVSSCGSKKLKGGGAQYYSR
jgi:hypothetical protein